MTLDTRDWEEKGEALSRDSSQDVFAVKRKKTWDRYWQGCGVKGNFVDVSLRLEILWDHADGSGMVQ